MTSKNLFFRLMKENTKRRFWTAALMCLAFFFLLLVGAAMIISTASGTVTPAEAAANAQAVKTNILVHYLTLISIQNSVLAAVLVVAAVLCGATGFSWLHSRSKTDLYHSAPVKREVLFFTVYINGILYTAVPYLCCLLLSALLIQVKTGADFPWGQLLLSFALNMSFYILLYSVVVLAFVMTGHVLVGLLGTAVFFFWGPGILLLKRALYSTFYLTYDHSFPQETAVGGSPLLLYVSAGQSGAGVKALWALAAALPVTLLSLFLYKQRPSEAAGRAMAFEKSKAPIKCLLVIPIALGGALFFRSLNTSDGWSVFGLICGLVISYGLIEIIYHFDFKKLFSHRIQLALCAVCAGTILVFFRFDLSGYDSYLPGPDKIESVGIGSYTLQTDVNNSEVDLKASSDMGHNLHYREMRERDTAAEMKLTDPAEIQAVREIAKQGIEDTKRNAGDTDQALVSGERIIYDSIVVQFHLKNGKNVTRAYSLDLNAADNEIETVYDSREYKNVVYPVVTLSADDVAGINYQEMGDYRHVVLPDPSMKEKLLKTYQEELLSLTVRDRREENIIASIQFKTNEFQTIIDVLRSEGSGVDRMNNLNCSPIYPSFKKTIALLKECGIDAGSLLTAEDLSKIEISDYRKSDGGYNSDGRPADRITVTDPEKMQEILDAAVYSDPNLKNYLRTPLPSVSFYAYTKSDFNGMGKVYNLRLDEDKAPDFIKTELDLK